MPKWWNGRHNGFKYHRDFLLSVRVRSWVPIFIKRKNMREINSIDNPLIKELAKLKISKYRKIKEQFLVEGMHLVIEAQKQQKLLMILATPEVAESELINNFSNIIIVSQQIINKLASTISAQPIIGVCKFLDHHEEIEDDLIILLDKIQDPTNLGNIMRSCVAFNVKSLYLSNDSVDIYNDKVIRSSAGAIFHLNIIKTNLEPIIEIIKENNFTIYGTFFKKTNTALKSIKFTTKKALLFGNEGKGISENLASLVNENFYIPTTNNVESLNIANALTITLYEIRR